MSFLSKHYEKIILSFLLLVFVVLISHQLYQIMVMRGKNPDEILNVPPPPPNYRRINFKDAKYSVKEKLNEEINWDKYPTAKVAAGYELLAPPRLSKCPFGPHLIPENNFPAKANEEGTCSFCGKSLKIEIQENATPGQVAAKTTDTDGDGIPDEIEKLNGLDPDNSLDALSDLDEDGFSNLEEFKNGTDMKNPKSRPPYFTKLFVKKISTRRLGFMVTSFPYSKGNADVSKWRIQVQYVHNRKRRTLQTRVGETFEIRGKKYFVKRIEPNIQENPKTHASDNLSSVVITREGDANEIKVDVMKEAVDPRMLVTFEFRVNFAKKDFEQYIGDSFELGDDMRGRDKYILTAADQATSSVVLKCEDGKDVVVKTYSGTVLEENTQPENDASGDQPPASGEEPVSFKTDI